MSTLMYSQSGGALDCMGVVSQCLISTSRISPWSSATNGNNNQQLNPKHIPQDSSTQILRAVQPPRPKWPHVSGLLWLTALRFSPATTSYIKRQDCGQSWAPQCEMTDELICLHLFQLFIIGPEEVSTLWHSFSHIYRTSICDAFQELFYDDVVTFSF